MQAQTTEAHVEGFEHPFAMDFGTRTWFHDVEIPEGEFPLVAEVGGKRYELFSDGAFAEEEL